MKRKVVMVAVLCGGVLGWSATVLAQEEPEWLRAVAVQWVSVGDEGNQPDKRYPPKHCSETTANSCEEDSDCPSGETCVEPPGFPGFGAVPYAYRIGEFEVTNAQYRAFLNAVARYGNEHELFDEAMVTMEQGGIAQIGSGTDDDPYIYIANDGDANWDVRPANFINFSRTLRFANWMHHGQPTCHGEGECDAITEEGVYTLTGKTTFPVVAGQGFHCPDALAWLPTEDEWYKAAYYDPDKPGGPGYWNYPTQNDSVPESEAPPGDSNSANYCAGSYPCIKAVGPPYYTTCPGAYPESSSAYGTFDQGGNVSEWIDARDSQGKRYVRGGSWSTKSGPLHKDTRSPVDPGQGYNHCGFRIAKPADQVGDDWVLVGDAGNDPDANGSGAVSYEFVIGDEVTNGQYVEFLNAVAALEDPNALYDTGMAGTYGGIVRTGSGPWEYALKDPSAEWGIRPVNFVSYYDALRFANWLHNGQPGLSEPVEQDEDSTEAGAYLLGGPETVWGCGILHSLDAHVWLPTENEWYKAAYYEGGSTNADYWDYATQSNTIPTREPPPGTDMVNGSANYPLVPNQCENFHLGCAVGPDYFTTPVGAYDAKPSDGPYGTFDQNGNVFEWTEAQWHIAKRVLRGGDWNMPYLKADARGEADEQDGEGDSHEGFRLATASDTPTTGACWYEIGPGVSACTDGVTETWCTGETGLFRGDWARCQGDEDENGRDDAFDVRPPAPYPCAEPGASAGCADDDDCDGEAYCAGKHCSVTTLISCELDGDCPGAEECVGVCSAPILEKIVIGRQPGQVPQTARRVRLSDGTVLGWVGEPDPLEDPLDNEPDVWEASLVSEPYWAYAWPDPVHVSSPEFHPHRKYLVQAIAKFHEGDIENEDSYSDELELRTSLPASWWDDYMSFDEMVSFMEGLAYDWYPDLCTLHDAGDAWEEEEGEHRDIWVLHITGAGTGPKPGVFYESLIHAHEWMTGPVMLYFANHLLEEYTDGNTEVEALVDWLDIYVVPVVNPDGYVYSYNDGGTPQEWRKNRHHFGENPNIWGVDLNRNWGYRFGHDDIGSNGNIGEDGYRGEEAFSEPETLAVSQWIENHSDIVAFLDLHGYAERVLWPWGYDCLGGPPEPDGAAFNKLGCDLHGMLFQVLIPPTEPGPVYEAIYPANGCSVDWAYGARGLMAFAIELRDTRDSPPDPSWLPPPSEIEPACEEMLPALKHLTDWALAQAMDITLPDGPPRAVPPEESLELDVQVSEPYDTLATDTLKLHYRFDDGDFEEELLDEGTNLVTLPDRQCGDTLEYYFSAEGTDYERIYYEPEGAPDEFFTAPVGEFEIVFVDDFESHEGWTVESSIGITSGVWERDIPIDDSWRSNPPWDYDCGEGGECQCYLTENEAGDSDVDDGYTWLISPSVDLSTYYWAEISYALWYSNDRYASGEFYGGEDLFKVCARNDPEEDWIEVETIGPETSCGWVERTFAVKDFVAPTNTVQIRFEASDVDNPSVVEAGIDHFVVSAVTCGESGPAVPLLPEDSLGVTCTDDFDCLNEARCVDDVCYAPKQRYLSIRRDPDEPRDTARRIKLDTEEVIGWVGEPIWTSADGGFWYALVTDAPHYERRWPDLLHVTGCEIAHASLCDASGDHCVGNELTCPGEETCVPHSYKVQAIAFDEGGYSDPLELHTPSVWGDVVGSRAGGHSTPPNSVVNIDDIYVIYDKIAGQNDGPLTWFDVRGAFDFDAPDQMLSIADVMAIISAFQGEEYPGDGPLNCP